MFGVPVDAARRIRQLEAQRTTLLGRLQRLDQSAVRRRRDAVRVEREAVLRDLEGVYGLLDAERARAAEQSAGGTASLVGGGAGH